MIEKYRIIVVIPAGRKQHLEILLPYILREKNIIDEIHLWLNTDFQSNRDYILNFVEQNKFIKIIENKKNEFYILARKVWDFYEFCTEPDAIYIKIDDDICFIEKNTIAELVKFRIENPEPFIVYPNIINNVIMTHLHQRMGVIPLDIGICNWDSHCENGLNSGTVASKIHEIFIQNYDKLDNYKFPKWVLWDYIRCSINFIVMFGRDIQKYNGQKDDESTLSQELPYLLKRPNVIFGEKIVSHFSYNVQRPIKNEKELLNEYKKIMEKETI